MKFIFLLVIFQLTIRLNAFILSNLVNGPICYRSCGPNLYCIKDNVCGCYEGYNLATTEDTGDLYCKSQCEQPCMDNGKCVAQNVCECLEGYELVDLDCKPRCSTNCMNGYCSAPEICECNAGYRSVGNSCALRLAGYITTTPLITTTTARYNMSTPSTTTTKSGYNLTTPTTTTTMKYTRASNNTTSKTTEPSKSDLTEIEESTEEFASSETAETSSVTGIETTNTVDYSLQMIVDDVELPSDYSEFDEKTEISKLYCPHDHVYYQGECRLLIREAPRPTCNLQVCGPNAYCLENGKCACLPGYIWHFNSNGNDISCMSSDKKNEDLHLIPREHSHQWMSNMFTMLGALCVTSALLCLLSVLYSHHK